MNGTTLVLWKTRPETCVFFLGNGNDGYHNEVRPAMLLARQGPEFATKLQQSLYMYMIYMYIDIYTHTLHISVVDLSVQAYLLCFSL